MESAAVESARDEELEVPVGEVLLETAKGEVIWVTKVPVISSLNEI
jgi:hypothetical protein